MRPVVVFDSGIGGLTVLKSLRDTFPHQNFIYLGDTARLPYGSKNPQTIRRYLEQCLNFLSQFDPEVYIVACNSASTQAFESEWLGRPLVNVIDPVVQGALNFSSSGVIGILGTRATIHSGVFSSKILALNPQARVTEQECPLFVPLAEEGWIDDPITNLIAFRYLQSIRSANVDTLILGCTHYPILSSSIQKAAGTQVRLLEAGPLVAQKIKTDMLLKEITEHETPGQLKLMVTDSSQHLNIWARNFLGLASDFEIEWVHL